MFLADGEFSQNCQLNCCLRWPEACMFVNCVGLKPLCKLDAPNRAQNCQEPSVNFMLGHLTRVNPLNV